LDKAKHILCIQPHPDDMDISCGGTLAALADHGAHITYLTVTDGSAGTPVRMQEAELAAIRRQEQIAAGAHIGVRDYRWLDYSDAQWLPEAALQADLIRAIRETRPDTVFTIDPWLPYESHPAHRTVGLCAAAAVLFAGMPNISPDQLEDGLSPHNVQQIAFAFTAAPNTQFDVSATWARKLSAIRAHQSQFPDNVWPVYEHVLTAKGREFGAQSGCAFAEALKVLAPFHLHCNIDILG
jgi:LmbE family N-acetylglucosaminyl deacetylase